MLKCDIICHSDQCKKTKQKATYWAAWFSWHYECHGCDAVYKPGPVNPWSCQRHCHACGAYSFYKASRCECGQGNLRVAG